MITASVMKGLMNSLTKLPLSVFCRFWTGISLLGGLPISTSDKQNCSKSTIKTRNVKYLSMKAVIDIIGFVVLCVYFLPEQILDLFQFLHVNRELCSVRWAGQEVSPNSQKASGGFLANYPILNTWLGRVVHRINRFHLIHEGVIFFREKKLLFTEILGLFTNFWNMFTSLFSRTQQDLSKYL